ncbi:uncharacterized protein LOC121919462 isoform X2 [Sceloporus undulatus]|uniref:uncharacterized protein LOC121919462 isoform X2 n=1 Tax=Sceloporus undulatus TaxID=8520 RepID=UPI001C4D1329|nr:uncharacterized protein LOC121919462 isoform X2 [Sceloporus undulatus]
MPKERSSTTKTDGSGSSTAKTGTGGQVKTGARVADSPILFFPPDAPRDSVSSKKKAPSTISSTPEVPAAKKAKSQNHAKSRSEAGTDKEGSRGRPRSRSHSPRSKDRRPASSDRRHAAKGRSPHKKPAAVDVPPVMVSHPPVAEPSTSTTALDVNLDEEGTRSHRRRLPTPSPVWDLAVDQYFYDSESDRFYMAVPRDVTMLKFPPRDDRYREDIASRTSAHPRSPPHRGTAQARTETVVHTIPSDSEPDLPPKSEVPSDDDDRADDFSLGLQQPEPASPTYDVRSFSEHVIKMSRALDIELAYPEEAAKDPIERWVQGRVQTPPSIPFLPSLESLVKRSWDAPASLLGPPRKIESLYKVSSPNAPWLASHPRLNSAIVEGAQRTSSQRQSSLPLDKEAKKIDALVRKAYTASALTVKAINYTACMGAYVQTLMEGISPIMPDVPDEAQRTLAEIRDEAHSIGSWLITASRNMAECTGRAMAASIALRRHAWLRGSDLNQGVRSAIEEMPIDDSGLFHVDTDDKLNRKFRMKAAARKHGMSALGTLPFRKRFRPWHHQQGQSQRPFYQDRQFNQQGSQRQRISGSRQWT